MSEREDVDPRGMKGIGRSDRERKALWERRKSKRANGYLYERKKKKKGRVFVTQREGQRVNENRHTDGSPQQ